MTEPGGSLPERPAASAPAGEHYRSADSVPAGYARSEPAGRTNGFLLTFAGTVTLVLMAATLLDQGEASPAGRDLVFFTDAGQHSTIPARIFLLTFFLVFAFWIDTNLWRRLLVAAQLVGALLVLAFVIDLGSYVASRLLPGSVDVFAQQVISTFLALVFFPVVVGRNAVLPSAGPMPPDPAPSIPWYLWARLVVPVVTSLLVAAWVEIQWREAVDWMRSWALLGGVGPGLFLFQQAFVIQTAAIGLWIVRRSRRAHGGFHPDVAVLIPAHNEAHGIAATIAAVAAEARTYEGGVRVYVVDNASTDATATVAEAAIAAADGLRGEVLACDRPGKAIALNHGLAAIREGFVIRIDADTVIGPGCLDMALRHLEDPRVGVVGGIPLPSGNRGFFDRVRLVEVLLRHGFFQLGLMGFGGVLSVPGMFAVYRKEALDKVGELVQGMNGEDTDISLRISSAGYRIIVDPKAEYYSETPQSWAHMREQRLRWFRSIYHVAGHNRDQLLETRSMAGAVTLPVQLINAARRSMFAPLLLAASVTLIVFPDTFPGLRWSPIVATFLGLPFLVAVLVCVLWRRWRALLYVPEYLVFRVVRSWFTLGAVLSLVFPPAHPGRPRRAGTGPASG